MVDSRTLAVQSVLYGNTAEDIVRAGLALANSIRWARQGGLIADWSLQLGDCSPDAVFRDAAIEPLRNAVEAEGGALTYTPFGSNLGSAAGHNALAESSNSELMLILNPDVQASADTVSVLAAAAIDDVGIVEARQIPLEHPKEYEKYTGDTSWASTACAMTTRAAFEAVDGFDSSTFFLYCDDVDYSWRLRLDGYRVIYEPAARVFHDKRLTITADWPASEAEVYYSAEGAILLAHKYSRPDLVATLIAGYRKEGGVAVLKAVGDYGERAKCGRLPKPIDSEHKVAHFIDGNYSMHRF